MSAADGFDVAAFRDLTARVIADEIPGFWSDWTEEQQTRYRSGDWRAFSVSRGYSVEAIEQYAKWRDCIEVAKGLGLDPYSLIVDLARAAAAANLAQDKRGEFLLSSHLPGEPRDRISSVFGGHTVISPTLENNQTQSRECARDET